MKYNPYLDQGEYHLPTKISMNKLRERFLYPVLMDRRYTFLFFFSLAFFARVVAWTNIPVDWNGDSFVHWQIAYLTLKIGIKHFRMWDLNGLEYYWGMVPHLVEALILGFFRTSSLFPYRLFNMIIGSINAYLVYLIGRDNFYWEVGFYSALFVAFFPVFMVFDITALQDTLALFFLLLGFYYYRVKPFNAGIMFALTCQSRIEYWLVCVIFIFTIPLFERPRRRFVAVLFGWLLVMVPFIWIFWTHTGNPFYPLWLSLSNIFSDGIPGAVPENIWKTIIIWASSKLNRLLHDPLYFAAALPVFASLLSVIYLAFRPQKKYYIYSLFIATMLVNGFYTINYVGTRWFWIISRILMSTIALGVILLMYWLDSTPLKRFNIQNILLIAVILSEFVIFPNFQIYQKYTLEAHRIADTAMEYYDGGTIVCDYQTMNYRFINKWHIKPANIMSNQYSPLYYGSQDPQEFISWFIHYNITLWIDDDWSQSQAMLRYLNRYLPQLLIFRESIDYVYLAWIDGIDIYTVNTTFLEIP